MRRALAAFCALLLRIFFRRIEVVGLHHVPDSGAVLFAGNHANGLLDPLMLLCLGPRPVSFLAKEPLFRMPLVGWFVRAFECLPVYRAQDGADPAKNRAMLGRARELLGRGNALALFPEGTSHSDPTLRPFKTGAARLALSARALGPDPVHLVPLFLYYESKETFRSRAVLAFGPPLTVPSVPVDAAGSPSREAASELTGQLRAAIESIAPTAESVEALFLAEQAERLLDVTSGMERQATGSLARRMSERRRLLDAYPRLLELEPERTARAVEQLAALAREFERRRIRIDAGAPEGRSEAGALLRQVLVLVPLAPLGAAGALLHAPAYYLIRWLAARYSGTETDVLATTKLVGGLLLFPLSWCVLSLALLPTFGSVGALAALGLGPLLGSSALVTLDVLGWFTLRRQHRSASRSLDFVELRARRELVGAELRSILELLGPNEGASTHPPR
ncbi:MAG TPA: 1-acyl-sn-glycerol-3-phosphate acyltransferase [Polyangiaceae bacterium]|nr:1-acyl-sn-glycerol-3-phosphate acyltransferase [Polyangiaceae bacterium]